MDAALDLARFIRGTMRRERPRGLSLQQFRCLSALRGEMASSPSELASYLELSPGAATKYVDQLAAMGLVARRLDKADGRRRRLALTRRGERRITAAMTVASARLEERLTELGEDDRELITRAMTLLRQVLRNGG